jgi:hypothetical protein
MVESADGFDARHGPAMTPVWAIAARPSGPTAGSGLSGLLCGPGLEPWRPGYDRERGPALGCQASGLPQNVVEKLVPLGDAVFTFETIASRCHVAIGQLKQQQSVINDPAMVPKIDRILARLRAALVSAAGPVETE